MLSSPQSFVPRVVALLMTLLIGWMPAAAQQGFPTRPIKIIVPYPPGGSTDVIARLVADHMAGVLKQPVIVDNRAGAAGKVGSAAVAHALPDGYTLLATNMGPAAMAAAVEPKMPYNPVIDFAPISMTATMPLVLCVAADSPFRSVKDLVAEAKSKPGLLNFATTGVGGTGHLVNALFASATGMTVQNIPYKGGPEVTQAVIGGQASYLVLVPSDVAGLVRAGRLRALAVMQKTRSPLMPDVPSLSEAGGFDINVEYWNGMLAPAGTPPQIIETLNKAIVEALQVPTIRSKIEAIAVPRATTPAQFQSIIASDVATWTKVANAAGIKVD